MTNSGFYSNRDLAPQWGSPPEPAYVNELFRIANEPRPDVEMVDHQGAGQQSSEQGSDNDDKSEPMQTDAESSQETHVHMSNTN